MNEFEKRLLHLHTCCDGRSKLVSQIVVNDPDLSDLYHFSITDFQRVTTSTFRTLNVLYDRLQRSSIDSLLAHFSHQHIVPLIFSHRDYPPLLKEIYDPPFVIYVKGNITYLHESKSLAVVGTRDPSERSYRLLSQLIPPLCKEGIMVVSGLALGVDGYAHQLTLQNGGRTIAVLGAGFDHIYPKQHRSLSQGIAQNHLLLSEYPPHTPPAKWRFPERNRIISGLTKATFVVEAKKRSGSLITAYTALEQGRDVYSLPGPIDDPRTEGCHRLIQEGALCIHDANDIVNEFVLK
ncbi:DNA-processing protein DprA [Texcoconibacillus texcoconensis]|uniref:DNA processing protein n=1 Tax=Texcoconibacillus texcoconensis TaxID=1095777 RepID=A0A840QL52_9BACI|nr:DNA-processing protein DprA [Texcoconibacillus texcoconensis]MBB5172090.1 DNA processing protein [Texcoconibacillus texcoconensis]